MRTQTGPLSDTVGYRLTGVFTFAMRGPSRPAVPHDPRGNVVQDHRVPRGRFWTLGHRRYLVCFDKKEPEAGDFSWSFDTTGGTRHVTHGIAHIQSYVPDGKTAVDHKGTIGGQRERGHRGRGCAQQELQVDRTPQLLLAGFGWTYAGIVDDLTGTVNNALFRCKAIGTVLFAGTGDPLDQGLADPRPDVSLRVPSDWRRASVGDITGISKVGWQYLWVEYRKNNGGEGNRNDTVPVQVNVDQVLPSGNFPCWAWAREGCNMPDAFRKVSTGSSVTAFSITA